MPNAPTGPRVLEQHPGGQVRHHRRAARALGPGPVLRPRPGRARQDLQPDRRMGAGVRLGAAGVAPARCRRRSPTRWTSGSSGPCRRPGRRSWTPAGRTGTSTRSGSPSSWATRSVARSTTRRRMRIQFPELARDLGSAPVVRVAAGRGARGDPRAVAPAVRGRLPGDHRGHHARRAGQRDRRPGRQPVQLPWTQLHHRRGLRLRPRRDGVGGAGPRRPASTTPSSPAASTATWASTRS